MNGTESRCTPLLQPVNGRVSSCAKDGVDADPAQEQSYDTVCHTECNQGYTAQFSTTRRCLADETWDGIDQICIGKNYIGKKG